MKRAHRDSLSAYRHKRNFSRSPEPKARRTRGRTANIFVVQQHDASHLHYDFRLAADGVLKSWALPKRPSMASNVKRLAIQTEDHPHEYRNFEGVIPKGHYGAGNVTVWDRGRYRLLGRNPSATVTQVMRRGHFSFELHGKRLKGRFSLVRLRPRQWLFTKLRAASTKQR